MLQSMDSFLQCHAHDMTVVSLSVVQWANKVRQVSVHQGEMLVEL